MSPSSPRTIEVFVAGPTTRCDVRRVPADYREFNRLVGSPAGRDGSISMLRIPQELRRSGYAAYCDDEALLYGDQPPNHFARQLGHFRLHGPVVFFRDLGDGEERSLTVAQVKALARYLSHPPTAEAMADYLGDQAFWAANPSGHSMVAFDSLEDVFKALGIEE